MNKYTHNDDGTTTIFIESKKHGKHTVLIDTEDWEKVSQHKWHVYRSDRSDDTMYAATSQLSSPRMLLLHRLVLNAGRGTIVDHKNHNGLDNRKSNLRICTQQENCRNQRRRKNNTSGYKGVASVGRGSSKWRAYITEGNKQVRLGNFTTKEEAARAYDAKAIEIFGEYAYLNFPEEHNRG